jgi:transposase-like protein
MKASVHCTNPSCTVSNNSQARIARFGFFRRRCDSKRIQRYRCQACKTTFSNQTFNLTYRQHLPRVNGAVADLLCSKVSMRQVARLLGINHKTVAVKQKWYAKVARLKHQRFLQKQKNIAYVQMDEMETYEHTICKPLSIALAVNARTREIIAARVAVMPAKGKLAKISRDIYGLRVDQRKANFQEALRIVKSVCSSNPNILTDMKPAYRPWIKAIMPKAKHEVTKGRRGCVAGYGEMKQGGFDPLFSLNHTAAMIRDNLARMLRRTWCGSKRLAALQDALDLYTYMHNRRLKLAAYQQ